MLLASSDGHACHGFFEANISSEVHGSGIRGPVPIVEERQVIKARLSKEVQPARLDGKDIAGSGEAEQTFAQRFASPRDVIESLILRRTR